MWCDSNPAPGIGFAPTCSREVRGSAGAANVVSLPSPLVIAWRMAAKASSILSSSSYAGVLHPASDIITTQFSRVADEDLRAAPGAPTMSDKKKSQLAGVRSQPIETSLAT